MELIELLVISNVKIQNEYAVKRLLEIYHNQLNHDPKVQRVARKWSFRLLDAVKSNGISVSEDLYILPTENGYSDIVLYGDLYLDCFITRVSPGVLSEDGRLLYSVEVSSPIRNF